MGWFDVAVTVARPSKACLAAIKSSLCFSRFIARLPFFQRGRIVQIKFVLRDLLFHNFVSPSDRRDAPK